MTAKEEDLLTSQSLLKKGIVLDRLIESVIIDKRIRPESLLVGDRNAVLVAARISGYGPEYKTNIACPACGAEQVYSFDLSIMKSYHGDGYLEQEATLNENGTFTTVLPRTKVEVTFKLLDGYDEKRIVKHAENAKKAKKDENNVTTQLKQFVVAVNGDTDQRNIDYVVENMPTMDVRFLRHVYKITNPNLDMLHHFECNSCDYEQELEVPITANFFWPE